MGAMIGGLAGGSSGHCGYNYGCGNGFSGQGAAIGAGIGLAAGALFSAVNQRNAYYAEPAAYAPQAYYPQPGFDVELVRHAKGAAGSPFHSHPAQWEFCQILPGRALVWDDGSETEASDGDTFLFQPRQAHQIRNSGETDLPYHVIADSPIGDACHYPDSGKWALPQGSRQVMVRGLENSNLDGE